MGVDPIMGKEDRVDKMLINKNTAISTSSILLVPYEASHVPTYHEWMKDEQIQAETASEPLTLEEEYAMQRSWRTDADKLTFIACLPLSLPPTSSSSTSKSPAPAPGPLTPGQFDTSTRIIGDVNLFLTPSTSTSSSPSPSPSPSQSQSQSPSPHLVTGELELMIAPTTHRRKGHGRSTILAFLSYITTHLPSILSEYGRGQVPPIPEGSVKLEGLRVKIGEGNEKSLRLFRSLGFAGSGGKEGEGREEPNYFGELELWFQGGQEGEWSEASREILGVEKMRMLRESFGVEGYQELAYGVESADSV